MSLDVWFQQDIQNTLLALHSAQAAQPQRSPVEPSAALEQEAFRAGFQAALQSVALAFGISLDATRGRAPKSVERRALRLREPGASYETAVSGAAEAQYE